MKTIYIARFKDDEPMLAKARLDKDTKKAIYIQPDSTEMLIGDKPWFTLRIGKNGWKNTVCFDTEQEALEALEKKLNEQVNYYNSKLLKIRGYLWNVRERLEE